MGQPPNPNRARLLTALGLMGGGEDFISLCTAHPQLLVMRQNGMTLLHHAIVQGNEEAVHQLLAMSGTDHAIHRKVDKGHGADPAYEGMDAIHLAEYMAQAKSQTGQAARYGAIYDALASERDGQAGFIAAVVGYPVYSQSSEDMKRRKKVIDHMLERHPGYLDAPEHGSRPLCWAAWKGQGEIVDHLLSKGANPTLPNESGAFNGMTPRAIAQSMTRQAPAKQITPYREIAEKLSAAEQQWQEKPPVPFANRVNQDAQGIGGGITP